MGKALFLFGYPLIGFFNYYVCVALWNAFAMVLLRFTPDLDLRICQKDRFVGETYNASTGERLKNYEYIHTGKQKVAYAVVVIVTVIVSIVSFGIYSEAVF